MRADAEPHQFNFGDHLSSFVLGGSFALEYSIRGAYEQTIGRLSEWTSSHELVEEDAQAARVAREYADFVYIRPFYEFHFAHTLKRVLERDASLGQASDPQVGAEIHPQHRLTGSKRSMPGFWKRLRILTYGVESADTYTWIENASRNSVPGNFPRIKAVKEVSFSFVRCGYPALPGIHRFGHEASEARCSFCGDRRERRNHADYRCAEEMEL